MPRREPMNERSEKMRLEEEPAVRGWDIIPLAHPGAFLREPPLCLGTPDVLDHRVAENHVERAVLNFRISADIKHPRLRMYVEQHPECIHPSPPEILEERRVQRLIHATSRH